MHILKKITTLSGLVGISLAAHAEDLFYEGFSTTDYTTGSPLSGQNGWVGSGAYVADGFGLTYTDLTATEGSSFSSGNGRTLLDIPDIDLNTTTVWGSFLMLHDAVDTISSPFIYHVIEFSADETQFDSFGLGLASFAGPLPAFILREDDAPILDSTTSGIAALTSNLWLFKLTADGTANDSTVIDIWINPTIAGITESTIGAATLSGTISQDSISSIILGDFASPPNNATIDELRLSSTFNGALSIVPEPSTYALMMALPVFGLVMLRRRKVS